MAPRRKPEEATVKGEFRVVSLGSLTPDPSNPRVHNPRNVGMIEDAMKRVGAGRSIVVNGRGKLLAGHGAVEAAAAAGIEHVILVPADGKTLVAVVRDNLTPQQEQELAIADNRTNELSTWSAPRLERIAETFQIPLNRFFEPHEFAALGGTLEDESSAEPGINEPGLATLVTCPKCGAEFDAHGISAKLAKSKGRGGRPSRSAATVKPAPKPQPRNRRKK